MQKAVPRTAAKSAELRSKCLLPPWIKYPGQPPQSMFWRMGSGEGYLDTFWSWFGALSAASKKEYTQLFQTPKCWPHAYAPDSDAESDDSATQAATRTQQTDLAEKVGVLLWSPSGRTTVTVEDLLAEQGQSSRSPREFLFFYGHTQSTPRLTKACFSQFWVRPNSPPGEPLFEEACWSYVCAEQYMMHHKALVFGDDEVAEQILEEKDPFKIKSLGRAVKGFDPHKWSIVARSIVCNGNYNKFTSAEDLRQFLLDTGDAVLVEASPSDKIWGIHRKLPTSPKTIDELSDVRQWRGENWLGFALMDVRDEIRRVYANVHLATSDA